jgi:hypothetical protein
MYIQKAALIKVLEEYPDDAIIVGFSAEPYQAITITIEYQQWCDDSRSYEKGEKEAQFLVTRRVVKEIRNI